MRQIVILVVLVLFVQFLCAKDLVVGSKNNNLLISTDKLVYKAIPLFRRTKDYTYKDPKQRIIKGIIARDLSRSQSEATIAAGGVGSTYVTLSFTSARGEGLNYLILIFSDNK